MWLKMKKQLIDMLRRIKVETNQLLFDMLRRINVVESEETTYWCVEKDKSWNLAAAIWYVKKDECCWKVKKQVIDMLRRIKVET